jgi:prevent-host-death family protein
MADIGIRELKARASQVVENVRRRRTRYVITHRGRPVAMIVPLDNTVAQTVATVERADEVWLKLTQLGESLAHDWPTDKSSADTLSEMRR